jgi:DNA-binding protein Fis
MQSQRRPKEIAATTMEGTRKRIPHKMWRDEVQQALIKYAGNK